MKILYAGSLSANDSALYRLWAFERLGHQVIPLNSISYAAANPIVQRIVFRLVMGPQVDRLNRDILELAERERPDVVWADKLLWMKPSTVQRLRSLGIVTVSYMIDNAFGPRRDPGWRLYMKTIPQYDLHVVQRSKNIEDYRSRGARDVIKIQTAYEPTLQFPPPADWSDRNRNRDVSFCGTPYDDRASVLARLSNEFGVVISGSERSWKRALGPDQFTKLYREGELHLDKYRDAIWRSKINLSFITHSNQDEFVHKSFEIAACGGFLLAERSQGHLDRFVEGEEAVFFTGYDELAAQIRRYLPDESARARIAAAGQRRAERDGYHNDRQVGLIVERIESILRSKSESTSR
jgi:spore maturation protein CgeB